MAAETVTLEFLGATLRAIQAEQRTLRAEIALMQHENASIRRELAEVLRVLNDRIGNFEALMEARLDQLVALIVGAKP